MFKTFRVQLNERIVVFRNSIPLRALGPGRHTVFDWRLSEQRWKTDELVFAALPEVRELLPDEWYDEVTLGNRQRGVLYRDGKPQAFLRPGVHRFWTIDPSVELKVYSVDEPMPELTDELIKLLPAREYVDRVVQEHERGLEYVQGKLGRVLAPGRYAIWSYPGAQVEIRTVDMRRQQIAVAGQELMTRDKVTLRLSLTIEYAIEDPVAANTVSDVRDSVYLIVQLAARDYLAGVSLDELLEGRDAMTRFLESDAIAKGARFGVRIDRVGVKDVVLPGEMKTLLNRVIEAEKEAAANVILRREETAATRSLANTARVIAEHPVLLRLKELEALKEIAERIDEVRLVVGSDGFDKLLPAQLLGAAAGNK
jgi:regulator of protease activity HflC (stomatin/prohibitin superfamily)